MYFHIFLIISPCKRAGSPPFELTLIPLNQGYFVLSLVEIDPVVLKKKILKFHQCIFAISYIIISSWKKAGPFIWINLNLLHPRMICAKFGWNRPSGSSGEDFQNFINIFSLFHNYLPLKRAESFIWINLKSLYPRMLCANLFEICPVVWRKRFFKFVNVLLQFCIHFPLEKGQCPSFEHPSPKDDLCKEMKFGWNWPSGSGGENFSNSSKLFPRYFKIILLEEGQGPSYEKTFIPFTQWCFVPSFVEICPGVL